MATIKIIVKKEQGKVKTNSKNEALIFIQYGHEGKSTLFTTGIKVEPDFLKWDKADLDQREPLKKSLHGYTTKNSNIRKVANEIDSIKDRLINQEQNPSVDSVKSIFEERFAAVVKKKKEFFELVEEFMKNPGKRANSTLKTYKTAFKNLKTFQEVKKEKISIENIDYKLYDKLINYFLNDHIQPDGTKGLTPNAVGNQIKLFKSFLRHIEKQGHTVNTDLKQFKVFKEKPSIIYLSQEELDTLYNYDFSENKSLERVRDLFICQCQMGLRMSDMKRLGVEHIQGSIIKMKAHKTSKNIIVPLTPKSDAILRKYNYELPIISEQKINQYLKVICQKAGINSPVEVVEYRSGKKIYTKYFKYELISTHTACKTFITHCGELGISAKVASEITGRSVKVILDHYFGTTDKVIEMEMQKAFGVVEPQLKVAIS